MHDPIYDFNLKKSNNNDLRSHCHIWHKIEIDPVAYQSLLLQWLTIQKSSDKFIPGKLGVTGKIPQTG